MTDIPFLDEWLDSALTVSVKTSGSTGEPKTMLVEKARMRASALMTCDALGLQPGDTALLCMSTDYIAGKMMVVRAAERNLALTVVRPSNRPLQGLTQPFDFIAMVPSQVYETLLHTEEAALIRQTRNLLIGGGAISKALREALERLYATPGYIYNKVCARETNSRTPRVFSSYGMTETLSHIALREVIGENAAEWYKPLPGISISLTDDNCLVIHAPQICEKPIITNDIAEVSAEGFKIVGRKDNVICSGGIKIQTEEVEALLCTHLDAPFVITKRPDEKFGEAVVLLTESTDIARITDTCQSVLPPYWRPKDIIAVKKIPTTETGKPARKQAETLAQAHLVR